MRFKIAAGALVLASVLVGGAVQPAMAAAAPAIAPVIKAAAIDEDGPRTEFVQWRRSHIGPRFYAPRPYGPRFVGPRFAGPIYRPWYRRPYYGTVIAGVAVGTIVAATAYGLAPRRPSPDLCWFWADEVRSRGYWDYC